MERGGEGKGDNSKCYDGLFIRHPSGTVYVPTYGPCVTATITAYVIADHAPFPSCQSDHHLQGSKLLTEPWPVVGRHVNRTTVCRVQNFLRSLGRCWPTCEQGQRLFSSIWVDHAHLISERGPLWSKNLRACKPISIEWSTSCSKQFRAV